MKPQADMRHWDIQKLRNVQYTPKSWKEQENKSNYCLKNENGNDPEKLSKIVQIDSSVEA